MKFVIQLSLAALVAASLPLEAQRVRPLGVTVGDNPNAETQAGPPAEGARRGRPLGVTVGRPSDADSESDAARPGGRPPAGRPDPDSSAERLAGLYASVRPFDANSDGKLDDKETDAVAKAIVEGKLRPGAPKGRGPGGRPEVSEDRAGHAADRIAEGYAALSPFDKNKDGQLNEDESAAVKKAIADGTLDLPHRGHGRGGPGARGHEKPEGGVSHAEEREKILATYDTNKDGKLDEKERAALRADVEAGKIELPGRPGRSGRGRGPGR